MNSDHIFFLIEKLFLSHLWSHKKVVWPEIDELLPDVGTVVGVGVVGVHVFDGVEYADGVQGIVVLQTVFM